MAERGLTGRVSPFAWAILLAGVFLRVQMLVFNRSFFVDESALALSIRDRTLLGLLQPLDHAQSAPIGFVLAQKLVISVAGTSEFAFRLLPLVAGIAALPVFLLVARRMLPRPVVPPAVALFAFSSYQIFWATDAKPYSIDVLATLLIIWLALRWIERPDRSRTLALAACGFLAPWFSNASVITLAGSAPVLIWNALRRRTDHSPRPVRALLAIGLAWLASAPAVLFAIRGQNAETSAYMEAFWRGGFLPLPLNGGDAAVWYEAARRFLYDPLGFGPHWLALLFTIAVLAGIARIAKNDRSHALLLAGPAAVLLVLSMANLYPVGARWSFSGRIVLFIAPLAFLTAAAGLAWIRPRVLLVIATITLLLPSLLSAGTPITRGEARDVLEWTAANARPTDVVYLTYALGHLVDFYEPAFRSRVVVGVCAQAERERYLEDLEAFRGTDRLWVVQAFDLYGETPLFERYMDLNAIPLDSLVLPAAASRLYRFPEGEPIAIPADVVRGTVVPDADTDCEGIFRRSQPQG